MYYNISLCQMRVKCVVCVIAAYPVGIAASCAYWPQANSERVEPCRDTALTWRMPQA